MEPEKLLDLPFVYEGQDWPLRSFVNQIKEEGLRTVPLDCKLYYDKQVKRALKTGSERTDLFTGEAAGTAPVPWSDLMRRAVQPVAAPPITSLTEEELRKSFQLRATLAHRQGRELAGRLLGEMEALKWKGWGNPFESEITPENCASFGLPQYFTVVDKSMSLPVIRRAMDSKEHYGLAQFRVDFDLMVSNALTYNPKGDPVHNMALDMKSKLDALLALERQASKKRPLA